MTIHFLESSTLAKLFVRERGSDALIGVLKPLSQPQKLVSSLSGIEVHFAIRRRERDGDLSPSHAADALSSLAAELAQMTEQPITSSLIKTAKHMVDRHAPRALDAIQLASCWIVREASGVTDIVFIASDVALLRAAAAEGFQTMDPTSLGSA